MDSPRPARLDSIDALRGLVMVLMALDHVRDFVYFDTQTDPVDLEAASGGLFLTRWVTHFCAPVFLLLTGVGAAAAGQRGRSPADLARFLITRGVWLVFLEVVVLRSLGWFWNIDYTFLPGWVIWVLGWSMVLLGLLLRLPKWLLAGVGLALILGHNAWDDFDGSRWGSYFWVWTLLHESASLIIAQRVEWNLGYPLVPWVAVPMVGYVLGQSLAWTARRRAGLLLALGLLLTLGFVALRASQVYGEPRPWSVQASWGWTVLSFLNCTKQPPSLCFLLMTLGPALMLWGVLELWPPGRPWRPLVTLGRVPLFYYLLHLPLIHALAAGLAWLQVGQLQPWLFANPDAFWDRPSYGLGLGGVYGIWLLVVAVLWPVCGWYAGFKQRRNWWWLSYL